MAFFLESIFVGLFFYGCDHLGKVQLHQATRAIPSRRVAPPYFSFRIMMGYGVLMLLLIAACFWTMLRNHIGQHRWLYRAMLYGTTLSWITIESG